MGHPFAFPQMMYSLTRDSRFWPRQLFGIWFVPRRLRQPFGSFGVSTDTPTETYHAQRAQDPGRSVSRHAERHIFRREEDRDHPAEDGKGSATPAAENGF